MREEAARLVDAAERERKKAPKAPPKQVPVRTGGSGVVRALGAVVGAVQRAGSAVRSGAEWCMDHRLQAVEAGRAFAAFAARYGMEAARDAIRSEIRRRVTGALTPGYPQGPGKGHEHPAEDAKSPPAPSQG